MIMTRLVGYKKLLNECSSDFYTGFTKLSSDSGMARAVLVQYLKNLTLLRDDYRSLKSEGMATNILAIDFSEIFLYMFHTRTARTDLKLVNYLFDKNLQRDYTYVMLPPAVFELRMYYERLRRIAKKYRFIKVGQSKELHKLYTLFVKLQRRKERMDLQAKECQEILALWKRAISKLTSYDFVLQITTEYGSRRLLEEAHGRLVNLLRSEVLACPKDMDVLSGVIGETMSDRAVFNKMLKHLSTRRHRTSDYINNIVDAEQAAIDFSMNKLFDGSQVVNIFTGSPLVLDVYEQYLKMPKIPLPLVRSPIYMMIRTFCSNELKGSFVDSMAFLDAGVAVYSDILKNTEYDLFSELKKELESLPNGQKSKALYLKALHYQIFFNIFSLNERFSDYLSDAVKSQYFDQLYSGKLFDRYYNGKIEDIAAMENIRISLQLLKEQKIFEERLAKAEEKIYRNVRELYRFLVKMLEGFNPAKLSPLMKEHYDFVLSEPEMNVRLHE